jgi:DNA-binding LytR/AlgR family response regulator
MALQNKIRNNSDDPLKIAIHDLEEIIITERNKIIYCQAGNNYTRMYLLTHNFLVTKVLKCVESLLPKDTFIRIHKSYLININYVSVIKHRNTIILEPDIELPIARRRKDKL